MLAGGCSSARRPQFHADVDDPRRGEREESHHGDQPRGPAAQVVAWQRADA
jgi:hypothetical protein